MSQSKPETIQSLALDFIEQRNEFTFKKLMERLKPGLLIFVSRFVNNDYDMCNEIVSSTFISVWEKIDQYNSDYNFSTWTYAIAKNEALGQLRLSRRNLSHEKLTQNHSRILRMYSSPFYMDLECVGPNEEELTQRLYDIALEEIYSLKEPYQSVMVEREIYKKQLYDIARDLDWNLNTVKTRLRKARMDIADSIKKKYPELMEAYNDGITSV